MKSEGWEDQAVFFLLCLGCPVNLVFMAQSRLDEKILTPYQLTCLLSLTSAFVSISMLSRCFSEAWL